MKKAEASLAEKPQEEEPKVKIAKKAILPALDDTAQLAEPFEAYLLRHVEIIKRIQSLMEVKLSENPNVLIGQLTEAERWRTRAKSMEAWGNSYLDLAERRLLVPPDRGSYTDTDRQVHLAAACNRERRFRDVCSGLVEGIDRRVSLGQSILKKHEELLRQGA